MKDKKLFISEDLEPFCKVLNPNVDTIKYNRSYTTETVVVYFFDGTKRLIKVDESNARTAIKTIQAITLSLL